MNNVTQDTGTGGNYSSLPPVAFSPSIRGSYAPSNDLFRRIFKSLVRTWRYETLTSSSLTEVIDHPAFRRIVSMGDKAVPLIIDELYLHPDLLVASLPLITGEDPVEDEDRGDFEAMAAAWLDWYEHRR